MQARAKALAEDEKNIAILAKTYPSFMNVGLPQIQSRVYKFLDEELLQRHNLLVPSKYLPKPVVHLSSPKGIIIANNLKSLYTRMYAYSVDNSHPQYMQGTATSRQHARAIPEVGEVLPAIQAVSPRKVHHLGSVHLVKAYKPISS